MKKTLRFSLGNISYLRNLFPEKSFEKEKFGDLQIPVLTEKSKNKEAETLCSWMEGGVFEALDKNYLESMSGRQ